MAYMLNSQVCNSILSRFLATRETTSGDEVLVDMNEPSGRKISMLTGNHYSTKCKAFVATTSNDRVLVAVFDIWGKFYTCYCCEAIRDVTVKKVFGGSNVTLVGKTQFGELCMEMYIANRQLGTDLKQQKEHKERLLRNLAALTAKSSHREEYPVSLLLKDAPKFTNFWGQSVYEPLERYIACYRGKEYLFFIEDKNTHNALLYTGDSQSMYEGFVYEGEASTCPRVGRYDESALKMQWVPLRRKPIELPKGAYCKEVPMQDIEYMYHRKFFAIYKGIRLELQDVMPNRVTLQRKIELSKVNPTDEAILLEAGFDIKTEGGEHMWMPDMRIYTKMDVPYNLPGVEFYISKRPVGSGQEEEIHRFDMISGRIVEE